MTPSIFIPVVGVATDALIGGTICNYAADISSRLAVPVIITAYFLVGMAIWLSIILYTIYFHRLLASGWPPGAQRPSLFILAGPYGQTAGAMLNLGTAAMSKFGAYDKGTFLTLSAASGVTSSSAVFALLLLGLDYFMIVMALYGLLRGAVKRELSYSLLWWGTIFPLGTTTVAWSTLSIAMDSPAFRVLSTALFLILLIGYFVNWGFTVWFCVKGDLLVKSHEEREGKHD